MASPKQTSSSHIGKFPQHSVTNNSQKAKFTPFWRLFVPLILQTGIIFATTIPSLYTQFTGKNIILQTVPVDPNDMLRGRYVALEYNISRIDTLQKLPGWHELVKQYPGTHQRYYPLADGTILYVIMQKQAYSTVWKPVGISNNIPSALPHNLALLRGKYRYGSIVYGLENYYMPAAKADFFRQDIFQVRQMRVGQQQPIIMEIKVDQQGNAFPMSMVVRDGSGKGKIYRF